jgi:hypothetical protein
MSNTNTTTGTGISAVQLTQLETLALQVLFRSSLGNGHDFGFTDKMQRANVMEPRQISGVISSLVKKSIIYVEDEFNGSTQFTWGSAITDDHGSGYGIRGEHPQTFDEFCALCNLVPA